LAAVAAWAAVAPGGGGVGVRVLSGAVVGLAGAGKGSGRLEPGEAGRAAHSAAGAPTAPDAPGVVTAPGVVSVGIDFEAAEHFADPADPTIAEVQAALEAREGDPLEAYRESLVLGDDVVNVEAFPGGDLDIDPLD
ncbi:hypothetical protein, partial [Kocuria palustris]|uniref:hypothetical protein n=1 Tax=Kocuria palustris TaxID=71999 RepID=UPI002042F231